jgi:SRSO17 transposase
MEFQSADRYRLYLPKEWAEDAERRKKTEVPEEVEFQTKPEIALDQIRAAVAANLDRGVVLADAAYGINTEFRDGLTKLGCNMLWACKAR